MAILALTTSLRDMRERFGRISIGVNSKREANRYDGNLQREFDYFSYFLRIDPPTRPFDPNEYQLDPNILGQRGETLAFEKVRIKYVDPTNFDTIKIEVLD